MSFQVDQDVFVPNSLVGRTNAPAAIGKYKVAELGAGTKGQRNRSLRVVLRAHENPDDGWVATSLVHEKIGISVLRIGDMASETALLDPLSKTLKHFLTLLVGDDYFHLQYLRTVGELRSYWKTNHNFASHLVLLSHGRKDGIRFVADDDSSKFEKWLTGQDFGTAIDEHTCTPPVHILSLACSTGYVAFSRPVATAQNCRDFTAPFKEVHGAIASQFSQTLFIQHFLHGIKWKAAVHSARDSVPGAGTFRLWEDEYMVEGATH